MNATRITWLSHATVLVQSPQGTNILIDPFISGNPGYPKDFELPSKIHAILLTHGHGDHIGDAAPLAKKHGAPVVAIFELASYMNGKGVSEVVGMNLGGTTQVEDVAVTMVDAKHSAAAQDEEGFHYVGVATGFVLSIKDGPVIYHAGDTNVFGDMKLIAQLYHPSIAILPIGGFYTMGPEEAALAVDFLKPKVVLPIHFGTFPPLKGTPAALADLVGADVEVVHWKPAQEVQA